MMKTEETSTPPKPKPPVPPKPVLKSTSKSPQAASTACPSVGHTDTSKPSAKENHATTSKIPRTSSNASPSERKPNSPSRSDKHIVRVESVESSDETCCSNLAYYICHKGPKTVARQVTNKPKPPAKPPKPTLESLARARAARRSFGDEIPAGKEGFKYVDDTSTESSADYKDIVFGDHRDVSPAPNKDLKSSQTADVNLADWEPLETSSRQSDHADLFSDDVVFQEDALAETKNVHFSPTDDLNATFEPLEAINYSVHNPITSSVHPVSIRHSWPRRTKKKKIPPKRPPPPKNYHRVRVYCSISDDERNHVDLSPEASPTLPRASLSNEEIRGLYPSNGNHALTSDGRYYCVGEKLSFYPYASSVQSHFTKSGISPPKTNLPSANQQEMVSNANQVEKVNSSGNIVLSPKECSVFDNSEVQGDLSKISLHERKKGKLSVSENTVFSPKENLRSTGSENTVNLSPTNCSGFYNRNFQSVSPKKGSCERSTERVSSIENVVLSPEERLKSKGSKIQSVSLERVSGNSASYESNFVAKQEHKDIHGEIALCDPLNNVIGDGSYPVQSENLKPSNEIVSCSWPRRTKLTPPARPPLPVFNKSGLPDQTLKNIVTEDATYSINKPTKPPHPAPPHLLPEKSKLKPSVPPRTKRKRSRTVEITPSSLQTEAPSRRRSYSLHDDALPQAEVAKMSAGERKSLYTAINKDPDRKKKPMAEPQVYGRMRFRPLPAPPPPPRKISKGKLDMLPLQSPFDDEQTGHQPSNNAELVTSKKIIDSSLHSPNAAKENKLQRNPEKSRLSSDVEEYRSELLKRYAQKHSEKMAEKPVIDSITDRPDVKDKVQLERYETVQNLYKEINDKNNCCDSVFHSNDKDNRLHDGLDSDVRARDTGEQQTNIEEKRTNFRNNLKSASYDDAERMDLCVDGNSNVSFSPIDERKQTAARSHEHLSHPKPDSGLPKLKKFDDPAKSPERVGSPRLLRREEVLTGYGVLLKEETIPSQTIGEMLSNYKHEIQRHESSQPASRESAGDFLNDNKHDLPRQESTQSVQSADGDEKEVFAIEVFVSSDAQSTKENSRDTSMEIQSLDNSYCVDENANVPNAAKPSQETFAAQDGKSENTAQSPKSPSKKLKTKTKRTSQSTFYFPANSEERSRSSSPQNAQTGDDSEVSGNVADVDSSAGSSERELVDREEGKRRNSIFYTDPPIKLEKSVQTVPQESEMKIDDEKSEDTDELMDIARDIKKELSLIIERHRKIQDDVETVPTLGMHLAIRKAVSSTQSSASEVSCQGSSAESEDENETVEQKKEKKLFFIAREIMTSEETFVNALKLLNEDFRQVVEEASKEKGLIVVPEDVLNTIFRFLPQLQNLNQSLLEEIKERIDDWYHLPKIADVLVKVGPFLKLYSCYIRDFETMTTSLDEACKKYPLFGQVVKDFEASPRCHKLALKHFLLKPVQRIPQYRLLLQDYFNHLTSDSVDYEDTTRALQIVSEVANHANETMKQGDNFLKLMSIQNSLLTSHEIIKPGRVFLKEGELLKLSRKGNQPRWFILFNDSLLYLTPVQQGIFRVNHELPLTGMRVSVPMQNDYQNEFSVISVTRSFSLAARTPEDREEWITALTRAIEENAVKRSSFMNVQMQWKGSTSYEQSDFILGKQAPVWIPDSRVTMCQLCTTEFTITFRRHHCRACGRVICSQCSANRAFLKYLDRRSARVCDSCFLKLQEEEEASKHKIQLPVSESESDPATPLGRHQGKLKRPRRYLPSVLKEVCANDQGSTISGYLYRLSKKRWKRYWYVLKEKVLYTYKASEDVAAKESIPVLGYTVETFTEPIEAADPKLAFQLRHPNQSLFFYAETVGSAERWVKAMKEATVLE